MRGTAAGEGVVSQANTEAFEDGYERVFGSPRAERGSWVWDVSQGKLVPAEDYQPPSMAVDAPVLAGRFYENTVATDGTDIGSRKKHREYMRVNGVTAASDYSAEYRERVKRSAERASEMHLNDVVGRAVYEHTKGR